MGLLVGFSSCAAEPSDTRTGPTAEELLATCETAAACSLADCSDEHDAYYAHWQLEPDFNDVTAWEAWSEQDELLASLLSECQESCVAPEPRISAGCMDDAELVDTLTCAASVGAAYNDGAWCVELYGD